MDDRSPSDQLPLFDLRPLPTSRQKQARKKSARRAKADQLALPLREAPSLRLIRGEGEGRGSRQGRLVGLPHPRHDKPLPSREEITLILLQAGADLVAGRISPTGASIIREAAEEALSCLEESELDPHLQPGFVRAARVLDELCS